MMLFLPYRYTKKKSHICDHSVRTENMKGIENEERLKKRGSAVQKKKKKLFLFLEF
jgi:hypothetical protein